MKLLPSDPDIETIVARIRANELDLQPDFQRGEVWSDLKKRRLIDTILRDWHVPPIHVIEQSDSHKQEVLDGQQRLVAIRDFVNGLIRVDGRIEPFDSDIQSAHDATYETLPVNLRRRFDRFTIRMFRLVDFNPEEPGELFFRLNQPTNLTAAEQRNAFFGPVRTQIRDVSERFTEFGLTKELLGFSNSRMAYDDIVAKLLISIERRTLWERITAGSITERYRKPDALDHDIVSKGVCALRLIGTCVQATDGQVKFNKATLFSWLCLATRFCEDSIVRAELPGFMLLFERARVHATRLDIENSNGDFLFPLKLMILYTDRASLRVSDVSSVVLRDAILVYCLNAYLESRGMTVRYSASLMDFPFDRWRNILSNTSGFDDVKLLSSLIQSQYRLLQ